MSLKRKESLIDDELLHSSHEDEFGSSSASHEDSESQSESEEEGEVPKPPVKKMATIMNKILSARTEESDILTKLKKREKVKKEELEELVAQKHKLKEKRKVKNMKLQFARLPPDLEANIEKENNLRVVATQGVVQLFSTIEKYKRDLKSQLSNTKSDFEKRKVYKDKGVDAFMKLLDKEGENLKSSANHLSSEIKSEDDSNTKVKKESKTKSEWNVLAKNFYGEPDLNAWDQEDSDDG